ncbi:MAG: hypothetical protein ABIG29_01785 [Candidatus Nealsonbacteria bacterium]
MEIEKRKLARKLRKLGYSINEICEKARLVKGSVSLWVRDVELSPRQKQRLSEKGIKKEVIEKRRITRLKREETKRQIVIDNAKREINNLSATELKFIGIALYWAEGAKTLRSGVQLSNSDPRMIRLMMQFFKKICGIPKKKFRGHVFLHPHLNTKKAEKYWQNISGIPLNQFYKTSKQQSKSSKRKKDNLPFGTFVIQICDTELFLKIKGWIEGINEAKIKK